MRFIIILMFWLSLINPVMSGTPYNNNNLRGLPFIQMMIAMMDFMGMNKQYYPGMNSWGKFPYSPMPGSSFGNFPMSSLANGQTMLNKSNFMSEAFKPESSSINNSSTDSNAKNNWVTGNDDKVSLTSNKNLNGIWQALSGDVIAIYHNNRFIWSDGNSRNLAGRLIIRGKLFFAYIPAKNTTLQFEFYQEPGQFVVRDKSGRIYTFKRIY
jgi:hypothetical protein